MLIAISFNIVNAFSTNYALKLYFWMAGWCHHSPCSCQWTCCSDCSEVNSDCSHWRITRASKRKLAGLRATFAATITVIDAIGALKSSTLDKSKSWKYFVN